MFVGVAFNFQYRRKLQAPAAGLAVIGMILMFGVAQHFNFLAYGLFLPSFAAAVVAFAAAMRFPNIIGSIPLIGFWADISYPLYVVHGLTGYVLWRCCSLAALTLGLLSSHRLCGRHDRGSRPACHC